VETTRLIHSSGWASSSGSVNHQSIASGQCYIPGSGFWSPGTYTHSTGSDRGRSQSENFADSGSATRVPFYEFHKFSELTSKTFRSLEEQVYIKKAQMKRQATQHAAVLIPGNPVQLIKAPTLRDCARQLKDRQREEFLLEAMTHAGCFKPPDQAAAEITAMDEKLLAEAEPIVEVRPTEKKRGQRKPSEPNPFDDILREHQKP